MTATSKTNVKFRWVHSQNAAPQTSNFLDHLHTALEGGDNTRDFFAGHLEAMHQLASTVATGGDSVWVDGTDEKTGLPVHYVIDGNNYLTVAVNVDKNALEEDSADYKQAGIGTVTLTTDQGTNELIVGTIEKAGEAIAGAILTKTLLANLVKPILKSIKSFLTEFFQKVFRGNAGDVEEAQNLLDDGANEAAENAEIDGEEVAEGIFANVTIGVLDVVGTVAALGLIALVVILNILAKKMSNYVKFYNVTDEDLEFEICYVGYGAPSVAPAKPGEFVKVPKISIAPHPPGILPSDKVIARADMTFLNTNVLAGIGYVLRAKPTDGLPDGFTVVVEIPLVGDNSLYTSLGEESASCEDDYNKRQGEITKLTHKATHGDYSLAIATNRLDGESPSPTTGEVGYYYEHLIVLEKAGI